MQFIEVVPPVDELLELYDAVSWTAYTDAPDVLHEAVEGSSFVVAARDGDRLVGLLRAISDDATIAYLQDLLVAPPFQRRGVGRSLLERFHSRYGHVRQRVLLTDDEPGQRAFYESMGFARADLLPGGPLRTFVDLGRSGESSGR